MNFTKMFNLSDKSVELYSKVELSCRVDSYPPPKITWYHNNTQLNSATNMEGNSTISIEMVDFDDLGLYSCVAENEYEAWQVNATLMVKGLGKLKQKTIIICCHKYK